MGGLALLARQRGIEVTGSDQHVYPPMSTQLADAGITLIEGYDPAPLQQLQPDLVVIGNALSRGNPSVEYVLDSGIPYTSGPSWLADNILQGRWVLAVAGTHGKTTTASMLAWILQDAGLQPGFLIGGVPENIGCSASLGEGAYFVIEADEYDSAFFDKRSKFIHYRPKTLVLNNLEFDHADIFDDLKAIQRQFHHLIRTVPASGKIIYHRDQALDEVLDQGCWSQREALSGSESPWQVRSLKADDSAFAVSKTARDVSYESAGDGNVTGNDPTDFVDISWGLCGVHNRNNALAAIVAAAHIGVSISSSAKALGEFQSVKRRLELLATVNGISVYDDFAHHPTAIATTLAGLRARYPEQRILAVIEPRSNTMRMGVHSDRLAAAITDADSVWWYEASASTELSSSSCGECILAKLFANIEDVYVCNQVSDIVNQLLNYVTAGDQIVIMSNGSFEGIYQQLIDALQLKATRQEP